MVISFTVRVSQVSDINLLGNAAVHYQLPR